MFEDLIRTLPALKSCPFCGRSARIRRSAKPQGETCFRIECAGCRSRTRSFYLSAAEPAEEQLARLQEMAAGWNARSGEKLSEST